MMQRLNPDDYSYPEAWRIMTNAIQQALSEIHRSRSYPDSMAAVIRGDMLELMMTLISLRPCLGSEDYRDYLAMIEAIPSCLVYSHES